MTQNARVLFTLALLIAFDTASAATDLSAARRPFRIGMFRMNRDIDHQKPLAVADSAGYVMRDDLIIGGYDRTRMTAWNYKQKKHAWWAPIDGELTSPPLLVENTLIVSTRSGKLLAINATNGTQLWEIALDAHSERPLLYADGKIYVVTVGQVAYSIEAQSGKRLWVYDAGFPDTLVVRRPPAPLLHDGRLVFGVSSGELVAVKIDDGKIAWRYNPLYLESRFHDPVGEMVIGNGKLLMTRYDGFIAQVEMEGDRRILWQEKVTSVSTSAFRAGRYYTGLVAGEILAYDSNSGRLIWRAQTGATPAFIIAGETVIYALASDGRLIAINHSTGEILWTEDLGSRIASAPIVTEDRMYISTGLRNVYGYKL